MMRQSPKRKDTVRKGLRYQKEPEQAWQELLELAGNAVPRGKSYLMPVGYIARLFKTHNGTHGTAVRSAPTELEIAARRGPGKIYLRIANLNYRSAIEATLAAAFSRSRPMTSAPRKFSSHPTRRLAQSRDREGAGRFEQ